MVQAINIPKKVEFPEHGITITFPPSLAHVNVIDSGKPTEWPFDKKSDPDEVFKPDGYVLNFELDPYTDVLEKEIEVEVKYSEEHLARAEGNTLVLGIYNGERWIFKSEKVEVFEIEDRGRQPKWKGSHKIKIKDWKEDPMVAWGP
jgi:hypothetical protein